MSNRSPKSIRCDDDLWSRFEEFVYDEEGQTNGAKPKHLENALREYLDEGRDARIEDKLDEVLTHVRGDGDSHTHKHGGDSQKGSETVEKVRQIAERVYTNHASKDSDVVPSSAVERAIEDIAGADPRTVDKYLKQLKRRKLLFQHPGGTIWTDEKSMWAVWCEKYLDGNPNAEIYDIIDEYDMSTDEYGDMTEELIAE